MVGVAASHSCCSFGQGNEKVVFAIAEVDNSLSVSVGGQQCCCVAYAAQRSTAQPFIVLGETTAFLFSALASAFCIVAPTLSVNKKQNLKSYNYYNRALTEDSTCRAFMVSSEFSM